MKKKSKEYWKKNLTSPCPWIWIHLEGNWQIFLQTNKSLLITWCKKIKVIYSLDPTNFFVSISLKVTNFLGDNGESEDKKELTLECDASQQELICTHVRQRFKKIMTVEFSLLIHLLF